jgi:PTH1 family peptidyl-tRNA hydrolase
VKLVVGLGNPGRKYERTRHNVGFRVALRFAERHAIRVVAQRWGGIFGRGLMADADGRPADVGVLLPQNFMNRSGEVVAEALRYLPVSDPGEDLVVVFDDVDLPFGRLRIRPSGGSAGHRGVEDIIQCLGSNHFARLRFGIDRPPRGVDTPAHVLAPFSPEEEDDLGPRLATAARAIDAIIAEGVVPAMNRFNRQVASGG